MLLSDVEELLRYGATTVVRNELLAETARTQKEKATYEGAIDGARMVMLGAASLYWHRMDPDYPYAMIFEQINNAIIRERKEVNDQLEKKRQGISRRKKKSHPDPHWPLQHGA